MFWGCHHINDVNPRVAPVCNQEWGSCFDKFKNKTNAVAVNWEWQLHSCNLIRVGPLKCLVYVLTAKGCKWEVNFPRAPCASVPFMGDGGSCSGSFLRTRLPLKQRSSPAAAGRFRWIPACAWGVDVHVWKKHVRRFAVGLLKLLQHGKGT